MKYVCADWRTCGCAYYVYVNFGAKGQGTIEEPVNNTHTFPETSRQFSARGFAFRSGGKIKKNRLPKIIVCEVETMHSSSLVDS